MTNRRYDDDEVREIFSLATTGGAREQALPAEGGGFTLEEIQRIGQEAGIEPARVALAAQRLAARGLPSPVRHALGMAIGMTKVIAIPRAPTDREWERLISQFRTVFGSEGVATTSGGLRQWALGDLTISVEPTADGEQLRLSSANSMGMVLNGAGFLTGGMAVFTSAIAASAGKPDKALAVLGVFGAMALASFGFNAIRSPRWARERERQLDEAAEQAMKLLSE